MPLQQDNMRRQLLQLPDIPSGYALPPMFSIVKPIARRNSIPNPSFELGTTFWEVTGTGAIGRTTNDSFKGAFSGEYACTSSTNLLVAPGFSSSGISVVTGEEYVVSMYARLAPTGIGGQSTLVRFGVGNFVSFLVSKTVKLTSKWQRFTIPYRALTSGGRHFFLEGIPTGGITQRILIDAVQFELTEGGGSLFPTTYIDGDQLGFIPNGPPEYFWEGAPHESPSQRLGTTRAGGRTINLQQYGFTLTSVVGLGLSQPTNQSTQFSMLDGGQYDRTHKPIRDFALVGRFDADTSTHLQALRSALAAELDRDRATLDQPLKLLYVPQNEDSSDLDTAVEIPCVYAGGLDGNWDDFNSEKVAIRFQAYRPTLRSIKEAGTWTDAPINAVANADGVIRRKASDGNWYALQTNGLAIGALEPTISFCVRRDGQIYIAGGFTAAGITSADYMALYDPPNDTFDNIAGNPTAFNGIVRVVKNHPSGDVVIGGEFTNANGGANNDFIVRYDNDSTFTNLGTGNLMSVYDLAFDTDSSGAIRIYAVGTDATMGGVANTGGVCYYDTSWHAMGTGTVGNVSTILVDGHRVYIGGPFSSAGGVANTSQIAYWDWSEAVPAWHSLYGTLGAPDAAVEDIRKGSDGFIYMSGLFTTIAGISSPGIMRYNGTNFSPVASPNAVPGSFTYRIDPLNDGGLSISGDPGSVNFSGVPTQVAFLHGNVLQLGTPFVEALGGGVSHILETPNGDLYVGLQNEQTLNTPQAFNAVNTGSARVYPKIRVTGPTAGAGFLGRIANLTTGRVIDFGNMTGVSNKVQARVPLFLTPGETLFMDLDPARPIFFSSSRGDISSFIQTGSRDDSFFLAPGTNILYAYVNASTITVTVWWPNGYTTLDEARGK